MNAHERVAQAITALFVPGDRPDRYGSAVSSGADLVIVDWEDAVAPVHRAAARAETISGLAALTDAVLIRLSSEPEDAVALRAAIAARPEMVLGVVVPKVGDPDALNDLGRVLGPNRVLVALVESAAGIEKLSAIARHHLVDRLAIGALDLAADLGVEPDAQIIDHARSLAVIASRAAGRPAPLDSPPIALEGAAVTVEAMRSAAAGFGGMLTVHPKQLGLVVAAFVPDDAALEWAHRVLAIERDGAVTSIDGVMVDRPVFERARAIVLRAARRL